MFNRLRGLNYALTLAFLLIFSATPAISATYNPHLKYRTIETEHFAVHFPEQLEGVAQKAAHMAEEVHAKLSPKFKWKPWGRTQVLIVDSSDAVQDMASVLPYNWIYLRATAPGPDTSLSYYDDWLRMLIIHEYSHILHLDQSKGFWRPLRYVFGKMTSPNGVDPGWMVEGMAAYEETTETKTGRGRGSFADMMLRTAILQDKFLAIDEADGLSWRWPSTNARYIYGVEFMQYLADKYGADKLYELSEHIASSPLLFAVNHQAKKTFSEMEFEDYKVGNKYLKRKPAGKERGKSFYKLWREWKDYLTEKYKKEADEIEKEGVTPFEEVVGSKGTITAPTISPDGTKIIYSEVTPFGPPAIMIADADGKNAKRLLKKSFTTQISYSKDGKFIVFAKNGKHKTYSFYNDLYKYDFETRAMERLTVAARATDPDVSPDGKDVVSVMQNVGTSHLSLYNFESKTSSDIPNTFPEYTQFANPRFSPDGSKIAVAVAVPGSVWDIYIFDRKGKKLAQVTKDYALDRDPVWGPDGNSIYFASDRSGVSNIYKYNLGGKKMERVTNVLTGVFKPALSPDGKTLAVQYYNGDGFDIRNVWMAGVKNQAKKVDVTGPTEETAFPRLPYTGTLDTPEADFESKAYQSKKYSPFKGSLFVPRFVMPSGAYIDNGIMVMAFTGGTDPLRWHNWLASGSYRTDARFVGGSFRYWYSRFRPTFDIGMMRYAVNDGNITFYYVDPDTNQITSSATKHLYENRLRGYAGVLYPAGRQNFSLNYFFESREPVRDITAAEKAVLNLGNFAGLSLTYMYGDAEEYRASISKQDGRRILLNFAVTNSIFGSAEKNEQYIFAGGWREYIGLGRRNVLAFRAAGGMTWGDKLRQGTFSLGGDLGEGPMAAGGNPYYFSLRGLPIASFSRDRAMVMSMEYRLPLISPCRGPGTLPVFLKELYLAPFADYGNAWNAADQTGDHFFGDFFLGVGSELAGNFVIGHGLPLTGRLGWGIIVVNRDRLGTLTDPLLGQSARKGVFILQLGTSF